MMQREVMVVCVFISEMISFVEKKNLFEKVLTLLGIHLGNTNHHTNQCFKCMLMHLIGQFCVTFEVKILTYFSEDMC